MKLFDFQSVRPSGLFSSCLTLALAFALSSCGLVDDSGGSVDGDSTAGDSTAGDSKAGDSTASGGDPVKETIDGLEGKVGDATEKVEGAAGDATKQVGDDIEQAGSDIKQAGDEAVQVAKNTAADLKDQAEQATGTVKTAVEETTQAGADATKSAAGDVKTAVAGALEKLSPPGAEEAVKVFAMLKDQWRMWGGNPGRNMVNPFATGIAKQWDINSGKNIKWKADLGSQSYGNPTIADGVILVGTNNDRHRDPNIKGDKGVIMAFRQEDGKFLWQLVHDKLTSGRVNDWPEQGICSTPVIEDGLFYYVSNECQIVCADLDGMADGNDGPYQDEKYNSPTDGDIIWIYDMIEELGVFPHNLATSSPLVVNDKVYVVTSNGVERNHIDIPSPRSPSFLCVDKKTGEFVWDATEPGEEILHGQWGNGAYGVAGGKPQVVFPGGDGWLYSYEPEKGELLWKFDCNPKDSKWELGGLGTRNNLIATPVFYGDSVYIAVGQDPEHGEGIGNLFRIRADGSGDVTDTKKVWAFGGDDFRRTISTVAIHDGLVYAADLSGFLNCLDQETGKLHWVHDLLAAVWGSPTVIDGKVYIGDEDGDVFVCEAGKKLVEVSEQNMDNSVYSTPVAVDGVLYIANRTMLFAIEAK